MKCALTVGVLLSATSLIVPMVAVILPNSDSRAIQFTRNLNISRVKDVSASCSSNVKLFLPNITSGNSISLFDSDSEREPNDTQSSANGSLKPNVIYGGQVSSGDSDYFSVFMSERGSLTVNVTGFTPDGQLLLYNSTNGTPIAQDYVVPFEIKTFLNESGWYYIRLYAGAKTTPNTAYTIKAIYTIPPPNPTQTLAPTLPPCPTPTSPIVTVSPTKTIPPTPTLTSTAIPIPTITQTPVTCAITPISTDPSSLFEIFPQVDNAELFTFVDKSRPKEAAISARFVQGEPCRHTGLLGLRLVYTTTDTNQYGGWGVHYPDTNRLDISSFASFDFWVKGTKGNEVFRVEMEDPSQTQVGVTIILTNTSWRYVSLPITNFQAIDIRSIVDIQFAFDNDSGSGIIYVDDLTLTPTVLSTCNELLDSPWRLAAKGGSAAEPPAPYQALQTNALLGKKTLRIRLDLNGASFGEGTRKDESAIIIDQQDENGLWTVASVVTHNVENGKDGEQVIFIPLADFEGLTQEGIPDGGKLDLTKPYGVLHARFWNSVDFVVEIFSIAACDS
jgi:hypothetical protein